MKSLYNELGGHEVIEKVVEIMYRKVLGDEDLVVFFADVDMARQHRSLTRFLHVATDAHERSSGVELRAAHSKAVDMGLSEKHLDAWFRHFRAALEEAEVAAGVIDRLLSRVAETSDDVLGR